MECSLYRCILMCTVTCLARANVGFASHRLKKSLCAQLAQLHWENAVYCLKGGRKKVQQHFQTLLS